jgi:hypothetical protein
MFENFRRPTAPPAELAEIRAAREDALAERKSIERRRVTRDLAEQRLERTLAEVAAHGPSFALEKFVAASPGPLRLLNWHAPSRAADPRDAAELVVATLFPDHARAAVSEQLETIYADGDAGITDEERAEQLQACDADLLRLELEEERAARADETIARRAEADVAVLLAFDDALLGTTRPDAIDVARLHHHEDAAAALRAAHLDALERLRPAAIAASRAAERAAAGAAHALRGGPPFGVTDADRAALADFAAARAQEHARLAAHAATLEAQSELAGRLARSCREYATSRGIDVRPAFEPNAPMLSPVAIQRPDVAYRAAGERAGAA